MLNPDTSLPLYVTSMSSSFVLEKLLEITRDLTDSGIDHTVDPDYGLIGIRAPQFSEVNLYPGIDLEVVTAAFQPVPEIRVLYDNVGILSFDIKDIGFLSEISNHQEIAIAPRGNIDKTVLVKIAILLGYRPRNILVMHKSHA